MRHKTDHMAKSSWTVSKSPNSEPEWVLCSSRSESVVDSKRTST